MLRWINDKKREQRIWNEIVRDNLGVAPINIGCVARWLPHKSDSIQQLWKEKRRRLKETWL